MYKSHHNFTHNFYLVPVGYIKSRHNFYQPLNRCVYNFQLDRTAIRVGLPEKCLQFYKLSCNNIIDAHLS